MPTVRGDELRLNLLFWLESNWYLAPICNMLLLLYNFNFIFSPLPWIGTLSSRCSYVLSLRSCLAEARSDGSGRHRLPISGSNLYTEYARGLVLSSRSWLGRDRPEYSRRLMSSKPL